MRAPGCNQTFTPAAFPYQIKQVVRSPTWRRELLKMAQGLFCTRYIMRAAGSLTVLAQAFIVGSQGGG